MTHEFKEIVESFQKAQQRKIQMQETGMKMGLSLMGGRGKASDKPE